MKTSTQQPQSINDFFEAYARALESYDTKGMAFLYSMPCSLVSDDTTSPFNDTHKLEGFFNQGAIFYKQFGITYARPEVWNRREWTGKIMHVKVNWQYYDALKAPVYNCDYHYVIKLDKHNQWKIVLSVSVNEKKRVEEWKQAKSLA
jgi:hypothetical protein